MFRDVGAARTLQNTASFSSSRFSVIREVWKHGGSTENSRKLRDIVDLFSARFPCDEGLLLAECFVARRIESSNLVKLERLFAQGMGNAVTRSGRSMEASKGLLKIAGVMF